MLSMVSGYNRNTEGQNLHLVVDYLQSLQLLLFVSIRLVKLEGNLGTLSPMLIVKAFDHKKLNSVTRLILSCILATRFDY